MSSNNNAKKGGVRLSLSLNEVKKLADQYSVIPVFSQILFDLDTPVSTFLRLKLDNAPYSFLLESVVNGEIRGRYSFLGSDPREIIQIKHGKAKHYLFSPEDTTSPKKHKKMEKRIVPHIVDPLRFLQERMNQFGRFYADPQLPAFTGGAVGYFAYDLVRYYEQIPDKNSDSLDLPDLLFIFAQDIILFDHIDNRMKIVSNIFIPSNDSHNSLSNDLEKEIEKVYAQAKDRIARIIHRLDKSSQVSIPRISATLKAESGDIVSSQNAEQFMEKVAQAKKHIMEGNIFQVVLSNRYEFKTCAVPFSLYRSVRSINPSPYLFFFKFKKHHLIGSSPEILIRKQGDSLEIRPIAGTRRRSKNEAKDLALEQELLADEKETAEHIMLVDLARNDLGRIAERGTVKVDKFKIVERYSHVMHIVSSCSAKLDKTQHDTLDAVRISLPAGTLSGAPKIRAMEIIDQLENAKRSYYGGALGYLAYNGDMDMAILIRTLYLSKGNGVFQSGAGIVYDSDPYTEWKEIETKAEVIKQAIYLAEQGLQV